MIGQRAGYLCEDQERCMDVSDLCKGYSCGPDLVGECDDSLQCIDSQFNTNRTLLVTPSIHGHYHCKRADLYLNNGEYDYVDRSDETRLTTVKDTRRDLPYFPPCNKTDAPHNPGILCQNPNQAHIDEFGEEECTESHFWCHVDQAETCLCGALEAQYSMHDRRLCSNPTLWRHISCDLRHGDGEVVGHGRRCTGAMQHCYYPWYVYTRYERPLFKLQCDDKSDQVHHLNTTCNITNYLALHNQRFCSQDHMQDKLICTNPEKWMNEVRNPIIADPHNCQASCLDPGPGCQACTNHEYFHCPSSGLCIHPALHCDGHPQCQNAEDEQFDECYTQYVDKGIVEKFATYKCSSAIYPEMMTLATVCDGFVECEDGSDEDSLCTNSHYLTYFLIVASVVIAAIYLLIRYCFSQHNEDINAIDEEIDMDIHDNIFSEYFRDNENHSDTLVVEQINAFLVYIKFTKHRDDIASATREFLNCELQFHNYDESEMFCCIRKQIDTSVCDILFPGTFERIVEKIEKNLGINTISNFMFSLKRSSKFNRFYFNVRKMLTMEFYYADLIKDTFLTLSILKIIGGPATIWNFPTKFTSIIVTLMAATILFPLILSGLHLALSAPKTIFKTTSIKGAANKLKLQVVILLSSILCPFLLQDAYESSKENLRKLAKKKSNIKLINEQLSLTRNLKTQFVEFMRIELGLEMFYQVTIQILLVLLSKSKTATTGGLQTMFENTSAFGLSAEAILNLSIAWSLRSCVYLFLKTKSIEKGYMPNKTKLVALLWSVSAILRRVLSMVAFFIPSIGLMDLLFHWKAEQIPFKIRRDYKVTTLQVHNLSSSGTILWSDIDRWDYSDPKFSRPPSYSLYTGLELQQTFLIFLVMMILHFSAVFYIKAKKGFGFQELAPIAKLIHVLENINFAFNVKDWDEGKCSKQGFQENFKRVKEDMFYTFTANTIFSVICLIPLWATGNNLSSRFLMSNGVF